MDLSCPEPDRVVASFARGNKLYKVCVTLAAGVWNAQSLSGGSSGGDAKRRDEMESVISSINETSQPNRQTTIASSNSLATPSSSPPLEPFLLKTLRALSAPAGQPSGSMPLILGHIITRSNGAKLPLPAVPIPKDKRMGILGLDLALSLLSAATQSRGVRGTLSPAPPAFYAEGHARSRDSYSLKAYRSANKRRLRGTIRKIPRLSSILSDPEPPKRLSSDAIEVLEWLCSSCLLVRPSDRPLGLDGKSKRRFDAKTPKPEFLFDVVQPPDPGFSTLRTAHGSRLLYHGSHASNWHSILRKGLQIMSNTEAMAYGAAFGSGIYFSDDLAVSRQFARGASTWSHSALAEGLQVVGVFEVIDSPEFCKSSQPKGQRGVHGDSAAPDTGVPDAYYVVTHPRAARLRRLLVWRWERRHGRHSCVMLIGYLAVLAAVILAQPNTHRTARRWLRIYFFGSSFQVQVVIAAVALLGLGLLMRLLCCGGRRGGATNRRGTQKRNRRQGSVESVTAKDPQVNLGAEISTARRPQSTPGAAAAR